MLEKLITNLKKSLPAPIRKKMGIDAEENEENGEEPSELSDSSSEEGDSGETSAEEKKKKQKSMIIKVVVIVALGYVALDEFVLKGMNSNEQSVEEMLAKSPAPKRRKKPAAPATADATTPPAADATASTTPEATAETPAAADTIETTPPAENINIADKNETPPVVEVPAETQVQIETPVTEVVTQVGESKTPQANMDQKIDQMIDSVEQTEPKVDTSKTTSKATMADKIVEDVVETAPPAYDQLGRGLVYNCKDKFWACLDKPAYVTCNKNMKWNKSKGNATECVVQSIYASDEDCAKIQKYNVSTNQSTAFCQ